MRKALKALIVFTMPMATACVVTPSANDTEAPTVSFSNLQPEIVTILDSTLPNEGGPVFEETVECSDGRTATYTSGGFPIYLLESGYPLTALVSVADPSGVAYIRVAAPNGNFSDFTADATLTQNTGGRGSTAYDRLELDFAGQTPRSPKLLSFTWSPDARTQAQEKPLWFITATDTQGNQTGAQGVGFGLVILTAEEICARVD